MVPKNSETGNKGEVDFEADLLVFGKWDLEEVKVGDVSLKRYINLFPIGVPHGGGRHSNKRFGSMKTSIVERLINHMMRTKHYTGKKMKAYKVVEETFDIINSKLDSNPIQILINALENSAPREETTRLRFGGVSVLQAVDTAPIRRLNIALQNLAKGALGGTGRKKRSASERLADEIIRGAKNDTASFAVSKKNEIERIAASAR